MGTKFKYVLKDGGSITCTKEDFEKMKISPEEIIRKEPVYETSELRDKLTDSDIDTLLDKA